MEQLEIGICNGCWLGFKDGVDKADANTTKNPEDVIDLETLVNNVSVLDAAHDLLNLDDDEIPGGILQVVAACLEDVKKLKDKQFHRNGNQAHCSH